MKTSRALRPFVILTLLMALAALHLGYSPAFATSLPPGESTMLTDPAPSSGELGDPAESITIPFTTTGDGLSGKLIHEVFEGTNFGGLDGISLRWTFTDLTGGNGAGTGIFRVTAINFDSFQLEAAVDLGATTVGLILVDRPVANTIGWTLPLRLDAGESATLFVQTDAPFFTRPPSLGGNGDGETFVLGLASGLGTFGPSWEVEAQPPPAVPEPSTLWLLGSGLIGLRLLHLARSRMFRAAKREQG